MKRTTAFCLLLFLLQCTHVGGQPRADINPELGYDADSAIFLDEEFPWESGVFVAAGYGFPQGFRSEVGYNMGRYFFAGLTFGIDDYWSHDPGEGTIGMVAGLHLPVSGFPYITPYALFCTGNTLTLFGGPDTYSFINVGGMIPLVDRLTLRPELSIGFTSKHLSGGRGVFGSSPERREEQVRVGLNVLVELAL